MPGNKKAVVIGINYTNTDGALDGACTDALAWLDVLINSMGFRRKNVMVLIDERSPDEPVRHDDEDFLQPNHLNLLNALDWLITDVREGDVLFLSYSGHATGIRDSCTNADGLLEEALVPCDAEEFENIWTPHRLLPIRVINETLAYLPAGVLATIFLDCNLIGGVMEVPCRYDGEFPYREFDNHPACMGEMTQTHISHSPWRHGHHVAALPRRWHLEPSKPFWSKFTNLFVKEKPIRLHDCVALFCFQASQKNQTAIECTIEGIPQGVMTYCFLQAHEKLDYQYTYEELFYEMGAQLAQLKQDSMPYSNQYFQLSFNDAAPPNECLFLNSGSTFVAKDNLRNKYKEMGLSPRAREFRQVKGWNRWDHD